jgi:hypothetical protein
MQSRERRLFGCVLIAIGVAILLYGRADVRDALHGAERIDSVDLQHASQATPLTHLWVAVDVPSVVDTHVTLTSSGEQPRKIVALALGRKWMLAVVPTAFTGTHVSGVVAPWRYAGYLDAQELVFKHVPPDVTVMDVQFDAMRTPVGTAAATGVLFVVFAGLGVLLIVREPPVERAAEPRSTPKQGRS